MEKQNNKKGIIILQFVIIIILSVLCILFATDVINFKINSSNNDSNESTENNVIVDDDHIIEEEKLPEWVQYLLGQSIEEVIVYNRNFESFNPEIGCPEPEIITKEQLKSILKVMVQSELSKYKNAAGFGGPCMPSIIVKYNNGQEFQLLLYKYIITTDSQITTLLEKENYTENASMKGDEKYEDRFAYEWDSSYLDTLLQ